MKSATAVQNLDTIPASRSDFRGGDWGLQMKLTWCRALGPAVAVFAAQYRLKKYARGFFPAVRVIRIDGANTFGNLPLEIVNVVPGGFGYCPGLCTTCFLADFSRRLAHAAP